MSNIKQVPMLVLAFFVSRILYIVLLLPLSYYFGKMIYEMLEIHIAGIMILCIISFYISIYVKKEIDTIVKDLSEE
jgi:hypothetical protein